MLAQLRQGVAKNNTQVPVIDKVAALLLGG